MGKPVATISNGLKPGVSEMDQTTYVRWWQLHLRVAKGDELDAAERATYEAGLIELDAEEKAQWTDNDLTRLRKLKAEVESLQATRAQLQAKSRRLDRQIRTLESAFVALTGIELSGLDRAPSPV
jgi:predicted RNase H-like nuclease (RuvC/YqgF family)